ncbi:MAG: chitobiase/beta-hexosaminidase C-terminal domain-containing protein [Chloroflexi bacterium]|nr:chitobiase/beta-hexosaminidase C-terminal domain-containing protein [Chloroflexota bacterium]MCL5275540.1 chitobiase/beta-hexosaminidase C-terminal domain-containing protein [Chloroflexota bacterium]
MGKTASGKPPPPGGSLASRVAAPTAYPPPGQFSVTQRITLLCPTPGARIFYTTDGAQPDTSGRLFDPYKLIVLEALNDGDKGLKTSYTVRAIAVKGGLADSDAVSFTYTMNRRDRDVYVSSAVQPGVRMISDFDDTRMFLIMGRTRALPLDVVITHAHPDHIALVDRAVPGRSCRIHAPGGFAAGRQPIRDSRHLARRPDDQRLHAGGEPQVIKGLYNLLTRR